MATRRSGISHVSTYLAALFALAVALIIPSGYFGLNYENINGRLDAESEINARLVTHLITENPELWRYENYRLDELLSRRPSSGAPEIRSITDMQGVEIAKNGSRLVPPVIVHTHEIIDAGRPVACLMIHTTLAPLISRTVVVAILGILIGSVLFLLLHMLPVRMAEKAEKALEEKSEFLARVMDNNTSGLLVIGSDGAITLGNRRFAAMVEMGEDALIGRDFTVSFITEDSRKLVLGKLSELKDTCVASVEFEARAVATSGAIRHLLCGAARVRGEVAESEIVISAEDITHRKESEARIRQMANFDELTALPNRALFNSEIDHAIAYARRYATSFALLVMDIDNFKRINDTLGHKYGDLLLQGVAERLVTSVRKSDYLSRPLEDISKEVVARLGGDEFTVLLTCYNHDEDVAKVACRMIEKMALPFQLDAHEIFATISIGIATYPLDGEDRETLFMNADTAMYHAKSAGKNTYRFYRKTMNETAMKRLNLENSLYKALERGEFQLFYQPRIDSHTGAMPSAEALIRWNHPEQGMVPPGEFISIAEENGLIEPMTEWVLNEACRQNRLWQQTGAASLKVSVNISSRIFKQRNLPEMILTALKESGLAPEFLEIEITESLMLHNVEEIIKVLKEVRDIGVAISIDDFGTGYSSFSYLTQLPVNTIKIDRSFVSELPHKDSDCAIVKAIIATSHSLGLSVVAEGVETMEQCEFLAANGCNEFQGYLFSRPVPSDRFEQLARQTGPGSITF